MAEELGFRAAKELKRTAAIEGVTILPWTTPLRAGRIAGYLAVAESGTSGTSCRAYLGKYEVGRRETKHSRHEHAQAP